MSNLESQDQAVRRPRPLGLLFATACLLFWTAVAAHGQHSLAMHAHSGTGDVSPCRDGFKQPIELYPLDKAGGLNHPLDTSPKAQQYFNQGLTFFYGFDSESALRSFYQASVADSDLLMAHWGIALAAGGDLNIPIDDPCMVLAREHIKFAYDRREKARPSDKLYIEALAERYGILSSTPVRNTQQLGVYYAVAMKSVYEKLRTVDPQDADAAAIYAYSLMNLRPWLWWTPAGEPAEEIAEVLRLLDAALPLFPNHIGLHHIHVHAMEEGPTAGAARAKDSADFLFRKAPFITPHLRHMPAHTYLLLGKWGDGSAADCNKPQPEGNVIQANRCAVEADQPWLEKCQGKISDPKCNQLLVGHYYSHDLLFLTVGYNNRGDWTSVQEYSDRLENNVRRFVHTQPGLEHYLTTRVMMRVHFGQWQSLTELPPPQNNMPSLKSPTYCTDLKYKLAAAMWYFGRVMGKASLGKPTDEDLQGFQKAQGCVQSAGLGWGNNSAADILKVVHWRMLERIARMKGLEKKDSRMLEASRMFALLAVETEDLLNYDEPPGWYLSSRETYGASLYLGGDLVKAEQVFREDQKRRPNNSRSLFGLWQTLEAQKSPEAPKVEALFNQQWQKGAPLPRMEDL